APALWCRCRDCRPLDPRPASPPEFGSVPVERGERYPGPPRRPVPAPGLPPLGVLARGPGRLRVRRPDDGSATNHLLHPPHHGGGHPPPRLGLRPAAADPPRRRT